MSISSVLEELNTSAEKGLSEKEAADRLESYGPNSLPDKKKKNALLQFLAHFNNVLIYVLIAAAIITAFMNHWVDTAVILAVVFINAIVGFIQEGKAEKALEGIQKMLSLDANVLRDGEKVSLDAKDLVPGDIIYLQSGDKVPADIRIQRSKNFRVEESPLTGESTDVKKQSDPVEEESIIGDQKSMAFSGTMVTYGTATGVVVATGSKTEIGKITEMISEVEDFTTPLLQKIDAFALRLSVFIVAFASLFFAFGYFFRDYEMFELFLATIGVIVASIPEGLPAIITITLAIGVQRMARRNAIIRKLPSVETLGSVSVICTDKTGTLTRNEMTVKSIVTADSEYNVSGSGYSDEGSINKDDNEVSVENETVLLHMLRVLRACNNASIEKKEGQWKLNGSPTEGALVTLAYKGGLKDFKPERIDEIPFESEHKFMATINRVEDKTVVYLKGAPERLIEMCAKQHTEKGEADIDKAYWKEKMDEIAGRGERLLAGAWGILDDSVTSLEPEDLENMDLVFSGITGIIDPPRDEAYEAIKQCKNAGIRVIMITGDHAITASAIAEKLGIDQDGGNVVTGNELEKMSGDELKQSVLDTNVYARTSPEHKLRIVKALQEKNQLVAMTGDGVNDAPALKRANIGVAMGIKGTEVSKDASEMVLADDNFASIVNAVEEGRTVYDNIRKTILFVLPTNGAEALVLIAAIILGITMPITPAQILWVNMVTAVTLALALAFEPVEKRVMDLKPRKTDEPILGGYFLWRIVMVSVLIGGFTFLMNRYATGSGFDIEVIRTISVNTIVAGQVFYLLNCRKFHGSVFSTDFFSNKYVFIAIGALFVLQLLFTYLPFLNIAFETAPISLYHWGLVAGAGVLVMIIVEAEKWMARSMAKD
ncbi:cation-transporting P-type ATPase [Balneolaceae bacterium ANBcel3]|nr:cation-transporting P-type ATPase [Balneolaceae bacterium ANBcel3]